MGTASFALLLPFGCGADGLRNLVGKEGQKKEQSPWHPSVKSVFVSHVPKLEYLLEAAQQFVNIMLNNYNKKQTKRKVQ